MLEAAELFCLSDEAAELLANKAGLSLQGEQEENTGVQKLFKTSRKNCLQRPM